MGDRLSDGIRQQLQLSRCPYCHDHAQPEESVACQGCLARHHSACWDAHGACSSCGERTALAPRQAQAVADGRSNPLDVFPEPLANSKIRVERTGDGLRLTLPGLRAIVGNQPAAVAMALSLLGAVVALGMAVAALSTSGPMLVVACAAAVALALGSVSAASWRRLKRERDAPPETYLELTPQEIRVDRIRTKGTARKPLVTSAREDVGNIRLPDSGLSLDLGATQVVLAAFSPYLAPNLTRPEAEWLRGILQRWRNLPVRGEQGAREKAGE